MQKLRKNSKSPAQEILFVCQNQKESGPSVTCPQDSPGSANDNCFWLWRCSSIHSTFNVTITTWYDHSIVTWSPDQPEQIKCNVTMGNSMITLKAFPVFGTISRGLFCLFCASPYTYWIHYWKLQLGNDSVLVLHFPYGLK